MARIQREILTVEAMILLYCKTRHASTGNLCPDCRALLTYAADRLSKCTFGKLKPPCARCAIHCYQPAKREAIRAVMRFSGPRMMTAHPVLAIRHILDKWHSAEKPRN